MGMIEPMNCLEFSTNFIWRITWEHSSMHFNLEITLFFLYRFIRCSVEHWYILLHIFIIFLDLWETCIGFCEQTLIIINVINIFEYINWNLIYNDITWWLINICYHSVEIGRKEISFQWKFMCIKLSLNR